MGKRVGGNEQFTEEKTVSRISFFLKYLRRKLEAEEKKKEKEKEEEEGKGEEDEEEKQETINNVG